MIHHMCETWSQHTWWLCSRPGLGAPKSGCDTSLIAKIDKLNESISSLKTKNDKLISKAKDLNVCNVSISCLRDENDMLKSKIDELKSCKPSTSSVDHVSICTRCRDINVDAIHDHLALIKEQNDHIAQLTTI